MPRAGQRHARTASAGINGCRIRQATMSVASAAATPIASTTPGRRIASAARARLAGRPTDTTSNAASEIPNATVTTRLNPAGRHPAPFSAACAAAVKAIASAISPSKPKYALTSRTVSTEVEQRQQNEAGRRRVHQRERHDPDRQHRGGCRKPERRHRQRDHSEHGGRGRRDGSGQQIRRRRRPPGNRCDRVERQPRELTCEAARF